MCLTYERTAWVEHSAAGSCTQIDAVYELYCPSSRAVVYRYILVQDAYRGTKDVFLALLSNYKASL